MSVTALLDNNSALKQHFSHPYTFARSMAILASDIIPEFLRPEAQRAACRYMAARGGAALGAFAGGAIGSFFTPAGTLPGARAGSIIGGGAGAALGAIWCPDGDPTNGGNGGNPLTPGTPYGQCATQYTVSYVMDSYTDISWTLSSSANHSFTAPGPIGPAKYVDLGPSGFTEAYRIRRFTWEMTTGAGTQRLNMGGSPTRPGPDNPPPYKYAPRNFTYVRLDGLPDNCGNSQGPTIPGTPTDIPDIRIDPFSNNSISIDVDFGGTIIPVSGNLQITGPTFSPSTGLGLGFNFDGLDFILFPDGTINIGRGNRQPPPEGPEIPPEDNNARRLTGVSYTANLISPAQSYDQVTNGLNFYPRFGSVRFKGKGLISESVPMHGNQGFLANPEQSLFNEFEFTPYKQGNTATFNKVYVNECCDLAPSIG